MQVERLAGRPEGLEWLAWITLAGALAASLGSILFGWLSDLTRNRRGWIAVGLGFSCLLLILIGHIESLGGLIVTVVVWQLSLNMMLGPLSAFAADIIPDRSKGFLGGMQAFAPGVGALAGALVTLPPLNFGAMRLELVAVMVLACVLPLLFAAPPLAIQASGTAAISSPVAISVQRRPVVRMWLARFFIQVAEATLFAYMFFWLSGLDSKISDHQIAQLFSFVMIFSAPLALAAGRWSDRVDRPIAPLRIAAAISAFGLLAMAVSGNVEVAMLAYGFFGLASSVFLALHSAQTLRILPRPHLRGRDLGVFNLANTLPSLVMPWLAMTFVPAFGFASLFMVLAVLALIAAALLSPKVIAIQD